MCNVAQVRYLMSFKNARRWAIIYNILKVPRAKRGVITVYILHTAHAIIICMCVCLSNDRNHCEQVALQLSLASTASSGGSGFQCVEELPAKKNCQKGPLWTFLSKHHRVPTIGTFPNLVIRNDGLSHLQEMKRTVCSMGSFFPQTAFPQVLT